MDNTLITQVWGYPMVPSSSQAGAWPTPVTRPFRLFPRYSELSPLENTLCEVADGMRNMMILTTWPSERCPITSSITGTRILPAIGGGDRENRQLECQRHYYAGQLSLSESVRLGPPMPLSYVFVLALAGTQQPRFPVWWENKKKSDQSLNFGI